MSKDPTGESSVGRRAFFRQLFHLGVEKVEQKTRAFGDAILSSPGMAEALGVDPHPTRPVPGGRLSENEARGNAEISHMPADRVRFLRPPGSAEDDMFNDLCARCGECVKVCPAGAIKLNEGVAEGLPHIIAREQPCVICEDLSCMKVCPSGALTLVPREEIRIGRAIVDHGRCLRGPNHREECRVCIDQCPIGESALGLDGDFVEVRSGCTGCGVCEKVCPTQPASIWIEPKVSWDGVVWKGG